jgi:hypothetical protein
MRFSLQQRLIASVLLMAYAITGTAIMPAAMALAAWVDGSHSVVVSQSAEGTQLTLHHRQNEFTPSVEDHQNTLARVLVSFCKASEGGDHQLKSGHIDTTSKTERESHRDAIKRTPQLNLIETCGLLLSFQFPASATLYPLRYADLTVTHLGISPMLATVQLLI